MTRKRQMRVGGTSIACHPLRKEFWLSLLVLAHCWRTVESNMGTFQVKSQADSKTSISPSDKLWKQQPVCPTEDPVTVVLEKSTGEWRLQQNEPNGGGSSNNNHANGEDSEAYTSNIGTRRRMLRTSNNPHPVSRNLVSKEPWLVSTQDQAPRDLSLTEAVEMSLPDYMAKFQAGSRNMSTDGSNSLSTTESLQGNVDTTLGGEVTTMLVTIRPCRCIERSGTRAHIKEREFFAICPDSSDYCGMTGFDDDGTMITECYSQTKIYPIAKNIWPLLWMWYFAMMVAVCCTFQGRILLDFVRGTILYYICGCGDRFQNRERRNVDRYNNWVVEEIMNEEFQDRQEVRRRRNNRSSALSRRMNEIANISSTNGDEEEEPPQGIPPTIITSPSGYVGDDGDNENRENGATNNIRHWWNLLTSKIVWPWQTSWKRYIKYNLLLRVEWIAMRDEVNFIVSRQERGLPHAQYEMKTRKWTIDEADACCLSVEQVSQAPMSIKSVDVPHCTICFCELEEGDRVGDLGCPHVFHADCLKMWVTKRNSCPLCNVPIARRRRIMSEEFVKDEEPAATEPQDAASNLPSNSHSVNREATTPSNPRRGQRRLQTMPMTPSTAAPSNYSTYSDELDDFEASDFEDGTDSPAIQMTSTSSSTTNLAYDTPTAVGRISQISESHEVDDESDNDSSSEPVQPAAAPLDAAMDINDYLARDSGEHNEQEDSTNLDDSDHHDIPSPPRRIRRRADDGNDEADGGIFAYSAFPPTMMEGEDDDNSESGANLSARENHTIPPSVESPTELETPTDDDELQRTDQHEQPQDCASDM